MNYQSAPRFAVRTVVAFESADGERFHSLEEAQRHTRENLFSSIFDRACADNMEFAKLDRKLLIAFLFHSGKILAPAITNPFDPIPLPSEPERKPAVDVKVQEPAIPNARPDASPPPATAEKLMAAARRGLESARIERADPGFPPKTTPVPNSVKSTHVHRDNVDDLDRSLESEVTAALARGFTGA